MLELAAKINNLFDTGVTPIDMVRRAATASADAIGFRPWYNDLNDTRRGK